MNIETNKIIIQMFNDQDFTDQDLDMLYIVKNDTWVIDFIRAYLKRNVTKENINIYINYFKQYCFRTSQTNQLYGTTVYDGAILEEVL